MIRVLPSTREVYVSDVRRLAGPDRGEVWLKLESANPTGSCKDRMALAMIEGAERSGRLEPGQTVVEYSGGSTGSSLAFVCAVKGYPLTIVTSDAFAPEKLRTMRAFGAELDVIPSPEGITADLISRLMERAAEIVEEVDRHRPVQQHGHDRRLRGARGGARGAARRPPRRLLRLRAHRRRRGLDLG
ncbi:MAG: pyridoxal-phosphate dependent enzyme [Gaiellaceae bacterium]